MKHIVAHEISTLELITIFDPTADCQAEKVRPRNMLEVTQIWPIWTIFGGIMEVLEMVLTETAQFG